MTVESTAPDGGNDLDLGRRAASGAIWITLETLGVQATSFAVFAVMARFILPSDVGLIGISISVIYSLKFLVLDNVLTVIVTKERGTDLEYTTGFWINLLFGLGCFVLTFASAGLAEQAFSAPGLAPVMRKLSVLLIFMPLSQTHEAWQWRHLRFRFLAFRALSGAAIGAVVGVTMASLGYGVSALISQQIVTSITSVIFLWIGSPWQPTFDFSRPAAKEIAGFMRSSMPNAVANVVNQNFDTFLVAFFFGTTSVGIYNVGKRVRMALQSVSTRSIVSITLTAFADLQNDRPRLRQVVLKSVMLAVAIGGPIFVGTSAVSKEAIPLLFGDKWASAVPVLALLSLSGLMMTLLAMHDGIFYSQRRPSYAFYVSSLYSLLALVGFVVCSSVGLASLALPFVLPYVLVVPFSVWLMSRRIELRVADWYHACLPGTVSSLIMYGAIRLVDSHLGDLGNLTRLLILVPLGMVVYGAALATVGREAFAPVLEMVRRKMRRG